MDNNSGMQFKTAAVIDPESQQKCAQLMEKIRSERPEFWPHGCSMDLFMGSGDSVYMVRNAATEQPVGFAGWQERNEDGVKVGYYAIGILPEFRRNGFAKEAISKLISRKSAGVDCVRALIKVDNSPSLRLAESLNVPVIKVAAWKKFIAPVATGLGTSAYWDYHNNPEAKYPFDPSGGWDRNRITTALLNAGTGAGGAHFGEPGDRFRNILAGSVAGPAIKDLALQAIPAVHNLNRALQTESGAPALHASISGDVHSTPSAGGDATANSSGGHSWLNPTSIGIMGALGLGGAALWAANRRNNSSNASSAPGPHIQIRLPGSHKGDDTMMDLPTSDEQIPVNLRNRLFRDARRRLRQEEAERTWHRGKNHKLITKAEPADEEEEEPAKEASDFAKFFAGIKTGSGMGASGSTSGLMKPVSQIKTLPFESTIKPRVDPQQELMQQDQMEKVRGEADSAKQEMQSALMQHNEQLQNAHAEHQQQLHQMQSQHDKELQKHHQNHHKAMDEAQKMHLEAHRLNLENETLRSQLDRQKNDADAQAKKDEPGPSRHVQGTVDKMIEINQQAAENLRKIAAIDYRLAIRMLDYAMEKFAGAGEAALPLPARGQHPEAGKVWNYAPRVQPDLSYQQMPATGSQEEYEKYRNWFTNPGGKDTPTGYETPIANRTAQQKAVAKDRLNDDQGNIAPEGPVDAVRDRIARWAWQDPGKAKAERDAVWNAHVGNQNTSGFQPGGGWISPQAPRDNTLGEWWNRNVAAPVATTAHDVWGGLQSLPRSAVRFSMRGAGRLGQANAAYDEAAGPRTLSNVLIPGWRQAKGLWNMPGGAWHDLLHGASDVGNAGLEAASMGTLGEAAGPGIVSDMMEQRPGIKPKFAPASTTPQLPPPSGESIWGPGQSPTEQVMSQFGGPSGAAQYYQSMGGFAPSSMGMPQGYRDATTYSNPLYGMLARMLGGWMSGKPAAGMPNPSGFQGGQFPISFQAGQLPIAQ